MHVLAPWLPEVARDDTGLGGHLATHLGGCGATGTRTGQGHSALGQPLPPPAASSGPDDNS
eukprot:3133362-Lingulodinium_polyedra.AAC.1